MTGAKLAAGRDPDFAALLNQVTSLQIDRGFRDAHAQFFIEGVRNVVRAVENDLWIDRIVFSERLLIAPVARQLVRRRRRSGVATTSVTPEQFRRLSQSKRASGIAAIVRQRWTPLKDASTIRGNCWILLETVRSPGNLGTLIRSSQALGGAGFILIGNRIDPFSPDVVRASMGAIYRQCLVRADWTAVQRWTGENSITVVGATPDADADLPGFRFAGTSLLMLGEERKGLTRRQRGACTQLVRIPMQDGVDSLNVGVAGSLLLYEVLRGKQVE